MSETIGFFFSIWVKMFFLFTPFFALSMFLTLTSKYSKKERRKLSLRVGLAVSIFCFALFFFGKTVFILFGITLDAFRVGAGALLFISAVSLVQGKDVAVNPNSNEDIATVPLALPIIVGPATIGTLMVLGADMPNNHDRIVGCIAMLLAIISVTLLLFLGASIEKAIGKKGINILSKIAGLVLAALAAQMILTGIKNFLR